MTASVCYKASRFVALQFKCPGTSNKHKWIDLPTPSENRQFSYR